MDAILLSLQKDLFAHADDPTRLSSSRYFKEEVRTYGVKTTQVTQLAKSYLNLLRDEPKDQIWALCEKLWQTGYLEDSFIACHWSYALRRQYEPADFEIWERWVGHYVNNWASCDTLCNHTVGDFVQMFPSYLERLKPWAQSPNRWMRRAAAVSLIIPARKGKFPDDILELADILLMDTDDLVQKGYGWMLKAMSEANQQQVFDYVMHHKQQMPRTALRYAIEKMPSEMRAMAMER